MKKHDSFYDSLMVKMGFLLHKKFSIHLLVIFIINLLSAMIVTGTFNAFNNPIVSYKIMAFILFVLVTMLIETILKVFILRHFISIIFRTFGIISLIIQVSIFMLGDVLVSNFNFNPVWLLSVLSFTIMFVIVRIVLIIFYQKYILRHIMEEV